MIFINKKEILCVEHSVFNRILNHWKEFEENGLPVVLEKIIQEINQELNDIAYKEFITSRYYF